jgi:hypothetical protein
MGKKVTPNVLPDSICITQDFYKRLITSRDKLKALEEAGVDNWEGYSDAMSIFYGNNRSDDV